MGRRVRRFLIIIPAAAAVLLSLLLTTCGNEFDIFEAIKTEMKIANDLFLEIKSASPSDPAEAYSQTRRLEIEFDREINIDTVSDATIIISPSVSIKPPDYNESTNTLFIYPDPYYQETTDYTVTVTKGVKGADGSELQDPYSWRFRTKLSPRGNFFIEAVDDSDFDSPADNSATKDDKYTASGQVKLYFEDLNAKAAYYNIGQTETSVVSGGGWVNPVPAYKYPVDLEDPSTDGVKTIFVGFAESVSELPSESELVMDTIILDTTGPEVTAYNKIVRKTTSFPTTVSATVDDTYSGVKTYAWSKFTGPGTVSFVNAAIEDASINSISSDGIYTLRLTSTDRLGNSAYGNMTLTVDRVAPPAPKVTINTTPNPFRSGAGLYRTVDRTPTWEWTQGAGSDGAEFYRYTDNIKSFPIKWSDETKDTSLTPPSLDLDQSYTLYVQERDSIGNWPDNATYGSFTIKVVDRIPEANEVDVNANVVFQWAPATNVKGYELYYRLSTTTIYKKINTTKNYYQASLKSGATYYWYYAVVPKIGRPVDSPVWRFSTQ